MTKLHCRWLTAFALFLSLIVHAPAAVAQTRYSFNLPEQSLADSLRAIGQQTATNILFEPEAVKNTRSPAIRGQFAVDEAIKLVLDGTNLEAHHTAVSNVVIRYKLAHSTALPSTSTEAPATIGTPRAPANSDGEQPTSTGIRENHSTTRSSSIGGDEYNSNLDEIIVTGTRIRGNNIASAVEVIDRSDIDRSGYGSLDDLMRSVTQNFGGGVDVSR